MGNRRDTITRRDFVRGTVGASVGASLFRVGWGAEPARKPRSARVVVLRDEKALDERHDVNVAVLRAMLSGALTGATGKPTEKAAWLSLLKADDVIGLVSTKHLNATHDELVEAVRASLRGAGFMDERIRNAQGGPDAARACTALIALPALKAHWLTGLGTVLKNYIRFSGDPEKYHGENNAKLGEIWRMPHVDGKTRIVIVDALRPLCDKGPQVDPRYLWDYKGLIAGIDPVAVETVGLEIITRQRKNLRGEPWPLSPPPLCVAAADERYGLGTSRLDEIKIEKTGWAAGALI